MSSFSASSFHNHGQQQQQQQTQKQQKQSGRPPLVNISNNQNNNNNNNPISSSALPCHNSSFVGDTTSFTHLSVTVENAEKFNILSTRDNSNYYTRHYVDCTPNNTRSNKTNNSSRNKNKKKTKDKHAAGFGVKHFNIPLALLYQPKVKYCFKHHDNSSHDPLGTTTGEQPIPTPISFETSVCPQCKGKNKKKRERGYFLCAKCQCFHNRSNYSCEDSEHTIARRDDIEEWLRRAESSLNHRNQQVQQTVQLQLNQQVQLPQQQQQATEGVEDAGPRACASAGSSGYHCGDTCDHDYQIMLSSPSSPSCSSPNSNIEDYINHLLSHNGAKQKDIHTMVPLLPSQEQQQVVRFLLVLVAVVTELVVFSNRNNQQANQKRQDIKMNMIHTYMKIVKWYCYEYLKQKTIGNTGDITNIIVNKLKQTKSTLDSDSSGTSDNNNNCSIKVWEFSLNPILMAAYYHLLSTQASPSLVSNSLCYEQLASLVIHYCIAIELRLPFIAEFNSIHNKYINYVLFGDTSNSNELVGMIHGISRYISEVSKIDQLNNIPIAMVQQVMTMKNNDNQMFMETMVQEYTNNSKYRGQENQVDRCNNDGGLNTSEQIQWQVLTGWHY